jgi:hypothetical protein
MNSPDTEFKTLCMAADEYVKGITSGDDLHSAVVDYTDSVRVSKAMQALPLSDHVSIVVAVSERERTLRAMARSRRFAGSSQAATAQRAALRAEAADYDRIGKLLADAWGLKWRSER